MFKPYVQKDSTNFNNQQSTPSQLPPNPLHKSQMLLGLQPHEVL